MKHLSLFLLLICSTLAAQAQVKVKSGLLLNGGTGSVNGKFNPAPADRYLAYSSFSNDANISAGYRFRLLPAQSRFYYDVDLNLGVRFWGYDYSAPLKENPEGEYYYSMTHSPTTKGVYASLGGTVGYKIYKGLSIGAGVEPTYYFYQSHGTSGEFNQQTGEIGLEAGGNDKKRAFDLPLTGRISYDFGFMEIGLGYKHGLLNTVKNDQIKSARFRDWQLSLFIPF